MIARAALDAAPVGFVLLDARGRFLHLNRTAAEALHRTPEELAGLSAWEALPDELTASFRARFDALVADGREIAFEQYLPPLDAWLSIQAVVEDGRVAVWFEDVTGRRSRAERGRMLVEQVPAVIWTTDLELRILSTTGRVRDDEGTRIVGRTIPELVTGGLTAAALDAHAAALDGATVSYEAESAGRRYSAHVKPRRDDAGAIVGAIGVALDVTEHRQAEEALAARARQQEAIAELGLHALAEHDVDAVAQRIAETVARTLDVPLAAVARLDRAGRCLRVFAGHGWGPGVVGEIAIPVVWEAAPGRGLRSGEPVAVDLDDSPFPVPAFLREHGVRAGLLVAVPGDDGPWGLLVANATTPRSFSPEEGTFLQSAANVLASALTRDRHERRFRSVFDEATDALLLTDDARRYVDANAAAAELLGRPRGELLALRVDDVFGPATADAWTAFLAAGEQRGEFELLRPDGSTRTVDFAARANVLPGLHLSVMRDVTEPRRLEEQLRRAQRLESVGQLAGGIAHDFNNLLTAIAGYVELVLARLEDGDPNAEPLREIARASGRAAELTSQLLAFGRRQVLQPAALDLNGVVVEVAGLLDRLVGDDVELVSRLAQDVPAVRADPAQLEQVIVNLAVNARDAMPHGGTLTIESGAVELDADAARRHPSLRPGGYAVLTVSDTGVGMDVETLARAFEPFFTTKEPGKGTGLGLSTAHGIVEQTGGAIVASSEPGVGSSFTVYLPLADGPAEEPVRPSEPPAVPAAVAATVLVVEDEPLVRGLVREILERGGYAVAEAAQPREALDAVEAGLHADVLVTDVVMPGSSGRALADALGERFPGLSVVYMSGYSDEVVEHRGTLDPGSTFLQKPFSAQQLLQAVRGALEAPAAVA